MSYLSQPKLASGFAPRADASDYSARPPFKMVPRSLVLTGTSLEADPTAWGQSGRSAGLSPDRVVLEYDETSGLFAPVWLSVRPYQARHRWRLQVTTQFEDVVGLLVHGGVPLIWLTAQWDWVGRNLLTPASPSYLTEFLRPIEINPA
jgi:hypothetical protein